MKERLKQLLIRCYMRKCVASAGIWFVDIPRTGSTGIRVALGDRYGAAYNKHHVLGAQNLDTGIFRKRYLVKDHRTAVQMRDLLGEGCWSNLFRFTVVRNPWDRFASLYYYRRKVGDIPDEWSLSTYAEAMLSGEGQFFFICAISTHSVRVYTG